MPRHEVHVEDEQRHWESAKVASSGIAGADSIPVTVEVSASSSPKDQIAMVGLAGQKAREARVRVESAILGSEFAFPEGKITINLKPASVTKNWTGYDLPIAVAILQMTHQVAVLPNTMIVGELSLDGSVNHVTRVLPSALLAKQQGMDRIIVPMEDYEEASLVTQINGSKQIEIVPVSSLRDLVDYIDGKPRVGPILTRHVTQESRLIPDFSQIKGLEHIKRALEVAMAGGHSVLMFGPAGVGKTKLAQSLVGILPPLADDELLQVLAMESIKGEFAPDIMRTRRRPFRSPHCDISIAGMTGSDEGPGELSLAHKGVLFLDEFPQFRRNVIEALRSPLQDGKIEISRKDAKYTYKAQIMLVAAANPCPCGNLGNKEKVCTCSPKQIQNYRSRLSEPITNRIDIVVEVPKISLDYMHEEGKGETSETIRERVIAARRIQQQRFAGIEGLSANGEMSSREITRWARLDDASHKFIMQFAQVNDFNMRGYDGVRKVARTIADLAGSQNITVDHVAEALQWRKRW